MQSLQLGPLTLPYGLLVTMAAIVLGWFIATRLARSAGIDADPVLTRMLLVGLVAARLGPAPERAARVATARQITHFTRIDPMTEKTFSFLRRPSAPAIVAGAAVAAALALVVASLAFAAAPRPAPREALERQAIPIVDTSANPGPLTAGAVWDQLEKSHWIADGHAGAPRTVYVFTDPNCPYCNKLWADARPWVDAGKVQLRHVMVGILTPTSAGKAAALLNEKNPAAALDAYERGHVAANAKTLASGRPRPLGDDGLKPLAPVPPVLQARLDANAELMASYGMRATPALVWKDANGKVQMSQGAPEGDLAAIYGSR